MRISLEDLLDDKTPFGKRRPLHAGDIVMLNSFSYTTGGLCCRRFATVESSSRSYSRGVYLVRYPQGGQFLVRREVISLVSTKGKVLIRLIQFHHRNDPDITGSYLVHDRKTGQVFYTA